jgi:hypothetical protein
MIFSLVATSRDGTAGAPVRVGGNQVPAHVWRSGASAVAPRLVPNTLLLD